MFFGTMFFILRCYGKTTSDLSAGLLTLAGVEMAVELGIFGVWLNG